MASRDKKRLNIQKPAFAQNEGRFFMRKPPETRPSRPKLSGGSHNPANGGVDVSGRKPLSAHFRRKSGLVASQSFFENFRSLRKEYESNQSNPLSAKGVSMLTTNGFRERKVVQLFSPGWLRRQIGLKPAIAQNVLDWRSDIRRILKGLDKRFLAIVGPCSIFDEKSALEYARRLKELSTRTPNLFLVMRAYFQKPRTRIGWKGVLNDPHGDGSCQTAEGLKKARRILCRITELGLPTASEILDPIAEQYICDLLSLGAIGARSITSQTHREVASGSSMPICLKNDIYGNIDVAVDAVINIACPQSFLGINLKGKAEVVYTKGNEDTCLVLRGGREPNHNPSDVFKALEALRRERLPVRVIIDASHGNSRKKSENQAEVFHSVINQRSSGGIGIIGAMLESNLFPGQQGFQSGKPGRYGVSYTDDCIGWDETERLLLEADRGLA